MKISCDVCSKDEASLYCVADEAALCAACDVRVHHANKLAGKHQRFSLIQPSDKQYPICDICQERRGFLFCQQDRAILCRECDIPIHKANEHTKIHDRFLLTGVKLSANSALYSSLSSSEASSSSSLPSFPDSAQNVKKSQTSSVCVPNVKKSTNSYVSVPDVESQNWKNPAISSVSPKNPPSIGKSAEVKTSSSIKEAIATIPEAANSVEFMNGGTLNCPTSSISEYLIDTLPGWHVEELLDPASPYGFCKIGDNDVMPFFDADLETNLSTIPTENMGCWVPQSPLPPFHLTGPTRNQQPSSFSSSFNVAFGGATIGLFKDSKEATTNAVKPSRKWSTDDNSFAVPQIIPPSNSYPKRSRTLW